VGACTPAAPEASVAVAPVAAQAAPVASPADAAWPAPDKVERDGPDADLMVQVGDLDNFGFGFPDDFDPFTGKSTPVHPFPFKPSAQDAAGTDRIMVVSGHRQATGDGYTAETARSENAPRPLRVAFDFGDTKLERAALQLFVDDFQGRVWGARYRVRLNGTELPMLETMLNALDQTGPIGKLITVELLPEQLSLLRDGKLELSIDDPDHDVADGFAFDFMRVLVNPKPWRYAGSVRGVAVDQATGEPLAGVLVSAGNTRHATTAADGSFILEGVPAGLAVVAGSHPDYEGDSEAADLVAGETVEVRLALASSGKTSDSLAAQLDKQGKVDLYGLYFDTDKDSLKDASGPVLEQVQALLEARSGLRLVVAGHTDAEGADAHNLDLSNRRAAAVVAWLVEHGIDAGRLQAEGLGESRPVAGNDSEAGRALNRRVELREAEAAGG
jgi:outer membrane protein OmpA-like peptidoglycan-associated protein